MDKDNKNTKVNNTDKKLHISDVISSFSDIKNLLIDLDFHHSWGYWISNQNKQHRIKIETTKNRIYLDMTKNVNYFDLNNNRITIDKKNIDLNNIKNQLIQYFN